MGYDLCVMTIKDRTAAPERLNPDSWGMRGAIAQSAVKGTSQVGAFQISAGAERTQGSAAKPGSVRRLGMAH
jgi:hypothetical protein